jgi:hypothetical protein
MAKLMNRFTLSDILDDDQCIQKLHILLAIPQTLEIVSIMNRLESQGEQFRFDYADYTTVNDFYSLINKAICIENIPRNTSDGFQYFLNYTGCGGIYVDKNAMGIAVATGKLDYVQKFVESGETLYSPLIAMSLIYNDVTYEYLKSQNCPVSQHDIVLCLEHQIDDVLIEELIEMSDNRFNEFVLDSAIKSGRLKWVQDFRSRGIPYGNESFSYAIKTKNYDLIDWVEQDGCPIIRRETIPAWVSIDNKDKILEYLDKKCPKNNLATTIAREKGDQDLYQFLVDLKFPIKK